MGLTPANGKCLGSVSNPPLRGFNAALHQISFPGEFQFGAADGNRTHVCALATHGSTTELRTLVHRADPNLQNLKAPDLQSDLIAA